MLRYVFALTLLGLAPAQAADSSLDRGRYLVERVGMCADCHSPRDATGQIIPTAWLTGAPVDIVPKHPIPGWASYAPQLAGVPGHYTDAALSHFLQTGERPDGSHAGPPMPPYRFAPADADAIVTYLRSLEAR